MNGITKTLIQSRLQGFSAFNGNCQRDSLNAMQLILLRSLAPLGSNSFGTVPDVIGAITKELHKTGLSRVWLHAKDVPSLPKQGNWHSFIAYEDTVSGIKSFTIWPGIGQLEFLDEPGTEKWIRDTLNDRGHQKSSTPIDVNIF